MQGADRRATALLVALLVALLAVLLVVLLPALGGAGEPSSALRATALAAPLAREAANSASGLATSLLSPRRLPDWLVTTEAAKNLATSVSATLTPVALGPAANSTCLVVTQDGRLLTSMAPSVPLIPASNQKLFTATAALDKLGPAFRYTTRVLGDRVPVGGVVTGNLYLVGSGDPFLRTAPYVAGLPEAQPTYTSLAQLAAQVKAAGVAQVTGSVIGDESLYDAQRTVPDWKPSYTEDGDVGPLSALDVNDGFALTGTTYRASPQPALAAAAQFATLLTADGVMITGAPGVATTPATAVAVTAIQSATMAAIVKTILTVSDDTGAELITKELGSSFGGAGSTAAGVKVIAADLGADGLPVQQYQGVDGSGLDRSDRASCQLVAADLAREGPTSALATALPVAGRTGTLAHRLQGPSTVGRIIAKTGTLDDVSALSGFVIPMAGAPVVAPQLDSPLVFSLIMDGVSSPAAGVALGNDVATVLAAYPGAVSLSDLGPLPRLEPDK